jgi:hypothetical protein
MRFVWILDRRRDLVFYLGSALLGWLYIAVILYAGAALADPLRDPLATFKLGGVEVPLTLELLVVASWAFLLDAPHVWATLGRTLLDPEEWRVRRREILRSFGWFLVGPAAILAPYLLSALSARFGLPLPAPALAGGAIGFFVLFRLWAYYHVVRQHWGFLRLYQRKADDATDRRLDAWFFNLSMYLPLVQFMTSAYFAETPGMPDLGLTRPLVSGWSLASVLHPLAWAAYLAVIVVYLGRQVQRAWRGEELNGSKLLLLAAVVPLHFAAFSRPLLAAFIVPLVTVGHNLQYHCIVYSYAKSKYGGTTEPGLRWARAAFSSVPAYLLVGLVFTFGFYRGPWIEWLRDATGLELDQVMLNSLGMMAGVRDPASLGLGEQIFAAALLGFAMQHYYLDAKIWRVSRDPQVQRHLRV